MCTTTPEHALLSNLVNAVKVYGQRPADCPFIIVQCLLAPCVIDAVRIAVNVREEQQTLTCEEAVELRAGLQRLQDHFCKPGPTNLNRAAAAA